MPKINKSWVETPWSLPAGVVDMEDEKFKNPIERYKHELDEIVEDDLIFDQVKNRLFLGLKMAGEQVAFYRQKQSGELCSCVDQNRQSAVSTCMVCHGTRFVGGYDYLGKTLVQFPQTPRTKIITELGMTLREQMSPWTLNFPLLRERDFLIRKMMMPLSNQLQVVEEPVIRGNYDAKNDILTHINLMQVWKLSNTKSADESDYVEGTDYILTGGEMVLEESGNAPVVNTRTLRLIGKKPPIFKGMGDQVIQVSAGLVAGMNVKVRNERAWTSQADIDATLATGAGTDTGYFVFTVSKTGIENRTTYPLSSFTATIAGDRIYWINGGNHPAVGATYYITYDYIQTYTERYQVKSVSPVAPQSAVMLQSFELAILEPTHPIYNVGSSFDNGMMIDFRNGVTKEMVHQLYGQFGLAPGNTTDKKYNQEAGYY
jgi:hypothetical protein